MELRKKISFIRYSTVAALILIPVTVVLKYFLFTDRIGDDGFFAKGDEVPYIFSFIWFAVVLAFLIFGFSYRIKFCDYSSDSVNLNDLNGDITNKVISGSNGSVYHSHPASRMVFSPYKFPAVMFANALCGLLMLVSAVFPIALSGSDNPLNALGIVTCGLRLLCAAYFIVMAFKKSRFNKKSMQISALILPIWAIFEIISLFFSLNNLANIFTYIFRFLAVSFIALFFITEAKFTLSNPTYYSLSKYVAFAQAAVIFSSASFVSTAFAALAGKEYIPLQSAFIDLAFLGVFAYIVIKLVKVNLYFNSHPRIFEVMK